MVLSRMICGSIVSSEQLTGYNLRLEGPLHSFLCCPDNGHEELPEGLQGPQKLPAGEIPSASVCFGEKKKINQLVGLLQKLFYEKMLCSLLETSVSESGRRD